MKFSLQVRRVIIIIIALSIIIIPVCYTAGQVTTTTENENEKNVNVSVRELQALEVPSTSTSRLTNNIDIPVDEDPVRDEETISLLTRMARSGPIGRRVYYMKNLAANRRKLETEGDTKHDESGLSEEEEQLSIEVPYEDMYRVLAFLAIIFVAGHIAEFLSMPSLVGEIVAGFLLGPPLADFVPYAEAIVLFGDIGLVLLILEAGIDIDVVQLKLTGFRAFLMAITGTCVPLVIGFGVARASGLEGK